MKYKSKPYTKERIKEFYENESNLSLATYKISNNIMKTVFPFAKEAANKDNDIINKIFSKRKK